MKRKKDKEPVKPWNHKGKDIVTIEDCPEGCYGFVYLITNITSGKKYIGKKALHSYHTKYSRVLNERTGRMNRVRETIAVESKWQDYFGSSAEIKNLIDIEGTRQTFIREIIRFCFSKKELTFREIQEQCRYDVLDNSDYVNSNIAGKFFKGEFIEHDNKAKSS